MKAVICICVFILSLWEFADVGVARSVRRQKRSESGEDYPDYESSPSWENYGNPDAKAFGKGSGAKKNVTQPRKYPWPAQPENWTQSAPMQEYSKKFEDIDDVDKDYYLNYDFEFAKGGFNHPSFQKKYLRSQNQTIQKEKARLAKQKARGGKPLPTTEEPPPSDSVDQVDRSFGGTPRPPTRDRGLAGLALL